MRETAPVDATPPLVAHPPGLGGEPAWARRVTGSLLAVGLAGLAAGTALGPLQALQHAGLDLYGRLPLVRSYYHGLSLHGVLNLLVWPLFCASAVLPALTMGALGCPLASRGLALGGLAGMLAGLLLAAAPLIANAASVLFTFYPPLQAHWTFYAGLVLVIAGTWCVALNLAATARGWRRRHPGARLPLGAFLSTAVFALWVVASLGVMAELVGLLLPWAAGWVPGTDVRLARTLFWFTAHSLVNVALLTAAVSWCVLAPRQAGGQLASDSAARAACLLLLTLSVPMGFAHEAVEPSGLRHTLHEAIGLAVRVPGLLLLLNAGISLVLAVRGAGVPSGVRVLLWGDPALAAQTLALVGFGAGGLASALAGRAASGELLHATMWTTGHAHLIVGGVATLTFMGTTYWLVPALRGRALASAVAARLQVWTWFAGMALLAGSQHALGLLGAPRRTMLGGVPYGQAAWTPFLLGEAAAAVLLVASAVLYFGNLAATVALARGPAPVPLDLAEPLRRPAATERLWDRWGPWLALTALLILAAYGPTLLALLAARGPRVPGLRPW